MRHVPSGLDPCPPPPRDQCFLKMSPLAKNFFRSSQSITMLPLYPKPSISPWGRPKTFAETRSIHGPRLAPWCPTPSPRQLRSFLAPSLPLGVGGWGGGGGWGKGQAAPPHPPCRQRQRPDGPVAPGAAGGEGPETGPQMPPLPPFLGRGPHGVGEQEESIRIMKPQPATHRGGTEESGPVPSPPDGSEERSPARPGRGDRGGCSGGSTEPVR